jgi:hypothetical protein
MSDSVIDCYVLPAVGTFPALLREFLFLLRLSGYTFWISRVLWNGSRPLARFGEGTRRRYKISAGDCDGCSAMRGYGCPSGGDNDSKLYM